MRVHRAAFHPSRMTPERYARVMTAPTYRPDLDLVAVAPDGSFAASCLVWFDPPNGVGLFEPVGSHPEHRRRGLAAAVCREGMRRLRALGAEWAIVLSWDEEGPGRLYESIGFREVMRSTQWVRPWPGPPGEAGG